MTATIKEVMLYTDGACLGNPGPGGYGIVLVYGKERKELSGGFSMTTNNRMELTAAITGLRALKSRCNVMLYTDSQYLVNAINQGWAKKWRAKGWMRTKSEKAQNADLWKELLTLCERHEVRFVWVRGHSGHPENERCDRLARQAAAGPSLPPDTGYLADKT
jgi:ribonuclease HI